jgi:hypothetical protein
MPLCIVRLFQCWFLGLLALYSMGLHAQANWPELKWEALVPKGWDPSREFRDLQFSQLQDSDPRAMEALQKLKEIWEVAPVEPSLEGRQIRIAGFALPLEGQEGQVTEFLIVPYFGACIHSPPPPANQIIHARSFRPLSGIRMMEPIITFGTLGVRRISTPWGSAGYQMRVDKVQAYKGK